MKKLLSLVLAGAVVLAVQSVWADSSTGSSTIASSTPMATPVVKVKTKKKAKKQAMKTVWVCPMGDYSGPKTNDGKCPNCKMDLVKKEVPVDSGKSPAKTE